MCALTGASVADVAAVGSVTIPMLKVQGYPAHFAGGIAACATCGPQIMPPVLGSSGIFPMVTSCVTAGIGGVFLAASISGCLLSRCGKVERLLLFASLLLLMSVSWQLNILGLACGGFVVVRQFFGRAFLPGKEKSL